MMASTRGASNSGGAFPCEMIIKAFFAETLGNEYFDSLCSRGLVCAAQTAVIFVTKCTFTRDGL